MASTQHAALAKAGVSIVPEAAQVEPVTGDRALKQLVEEDTFMEEPVEIMIHQGYGDSDPDHVVLNCNGTNMVVFRGVATTVKRKYVEILARMSETRYSQRRHPINLDQSDLIPRTGLVYPFDVVTDENPKGRAWLRAIIAHPDA